MTQTHLAKPWKCPGGIGLLLGFDNHRFLSDESSLHNRASNLSLTECQKCGYCCLMRPCTPLPSEIPKVAKYLGIKVEDLVRKYMVVDKWPKSNYHLLWAWETQLDITGKLLPYNRTWDRGYCIFFDRKTHLCKIYPVRPKVAKLTECWTWDDVSSPLRYWGKNTIYRFLPGFQPEED